MSAEISQTGRRRAERGSALEQRVQAALRHAQLVSPHSPEGARRRAALARLQAERAELQAAAETQPGRDQVRGPKGTRIGDLIKAERSWWRVTGIEPGRREAVCVLVGGSRVMRHFRARRIEAVERPQAVDA